MLRTNFRLVISFLTHRRSDAFQESADRSPSEATGKVDQRGEIGQCVPLAVRHQHGSHAATAPEGNDRCLSGQTGNGIISKPDGRR